MIFVPPGANKQTRVHGAWVADDEVRAVCDFLRKQGTAVYEEVVLATEEEVAAGADDDLNEALRPCTRTDVIGIWAMIRQGTARSVQVDSTDPSFYPYQRFAFRADASVRHLAAPAPVGPEEQRVILSAPTTVTWSVDRQGRLL